MKIEHRPARPEDALACITLRGQTRENAVAASRLAELGITAESWAAQIRSGQLPGHIALTQGQGQGHDPGQMAGYCFGDTGTGEIVVLALLPEFEGQGLGAELLSRMMAQLRGLGHGRLFLGCSDDPASRSYGFYRHLGWRSTGQQDGHGDEMLEHLPK